MNLSLLKADIKVNRNIFIIISAILTMYIIIMISMYDPNNMQALEEMMEMFPKEMINALGFNIVGNDLTGFLAGYIYGMLIFLFPMIFVFTINNRLIVKHVDTGSMAYLLSTPNSRQKIAVTQGLFSVISITILIIFVMVLSIVFASIINPGEMNIGQFIILNLYTIAFYVVISGISFIASCLFNDTSNSLALGSGVPVAFFVLQMLS